MRTEFNRRANSLASTSEGRIAFRDLSSQIRQKVAEQFPEHGIVNQRYAGRMGQIDAMMNTRDAFLSNDTRGSRRHFVASHPVNGTYIDN